MIITGGIYKGRKIIAPNENITRPTLSKTRMGVFNVLYSIIGSFEDKSFFDAFGGSGIMGLEAISRGFKDVTVCEINKQAAVVIKKNYTTMGIEPNLFIGDCRKLAKETKRIYDVVYIDPPYKSQIYEEIIKNINGKIIIAEHDKSVDLSKYNIIKEKTYGSNLITFIDRNNN